jgi:GDP-L-fucose synthase
VDTGSRVINPISNCAYPGHINRFSEELFWDGPVHDSVYAYGNTRRTLVASSKIYADSLGLEVRNLVLPNLYGPGEKRDPEQAHALGGLVGRMVLAKKNNDEKFVVWGSGLPIREWLFVEDAADLMVEASQSDQVFHLRNFGIGKGISIAELTELIAVYLEYNGDIVFDYSKPDGALEKIMVINDDSPKLSNKKYTELKIGIQKTIAWYRNS